MKALYTNVVMRMHTEKGLTNPKPEELTKTAWGDPFYNALHVKYGYALTYHKSLGGEWNTVYVDFSRRAGSDADSLRWKCIAITRVSRMLWCINLPDVIPTTFLKITPINKAAETAVNALSFDNIENTSFHPSSILPSVECKCWSVVKSMNGTLYSVKNVICRPWRDVCEINTSTGIVRIDTMYNGAGLLTKYETDANNAELLFFFQSDENIKYKINYRPSLESLGMPHSRMISLCDECGIILTDMIEGHYQLVCYMKAPGDYVAATFLFSEKGFINYTTPLSGIGETDIKLSQLMGKLTQLKNINVCKRSNTIA